MLHISLTFYPNLHHTKVKALSGVGTRYPPHGSCWGCLAKSAGNSKQSEDFLAEQDEVSPLPDARGLMDEVHCQKTSLALEVIDLW